MTRKKTERVTVAAVRKVETLANWTISQLAVESDISQDESFLLISVSIALLDSY